MRKHFIWKVQEAIKVCFNQTFFFLFIYCFDGPTENGAYSFKSIGIAEQICINTKKEKSGVSLFLIGTLQMLLKKEDCAYVSSVMVSWVIISMRRTFCKTESALYGLIQMAGIVFAVLGRRKW